MDSARKQPAEVLLADRVIFGGKAGLSFMNLSTEKPTRDLRPTSLSVWMTSSVAVFVLLGSLLLVLVFERHLDREERRAFEGLARTNASFLERICRKARKWRINSVRSSARGCFSGIPGRAR
jgi:hypothetical protein